MEAVNGFEVIKLYGLKRWWQDKMADYHREYLVIGRKADAVNAAQRSMYRLLDNILKFGTYVLMGLYAMLGYCTMDVAVQAIYLSGNLFGTVKNLFSMIPEIAVSREAGKRLGKWVWQKDSLKRPVERSEDGSMAVRDLYYSYGQSGVLKGVNYRFCPGKNYLIKGANGAGKSTLLHILTGLLLPEQGQVIVPGEEADSPSVFFIPQQDPEFSFDIRTLFAMYGEERQKRIAAIAGRFGLPEEIWSKNGMRDLSGGQRKKACLAVGFGIQPRWLLLDEPSNNLDSHGREVLSGLIRERKGTIIISHDPYLEKAADCIMKIEGGQIYGEEG